MCTTCGCSDETHTTITAFDRHSPHSSATTRAHHESHEIDSPHQHHEQGNATHHHHHHAEHHDSSDHAALHDQRTERTLRLEQEILAKNKRIAERNREWFARRQIVACNLMSSPGAGKTTLLERTINDLRAELPISVIEGDQETSRDAARIRNAGCRAVQINTGAGCHLDAAMLAAAIEKLEPPTRSIVMIENIGNLVCPALFDLGEQSRVVIMSVTEGDDKPLKYPQMFRAGELMLLNKIDLLPYVPFDVERCVEYTRQTNPALQVVQVSATRGDGMAAWYSWLREKMKSSFVSNTQFERNEVE